MKFTRLVTILLFAMVALSACSSSPTTDATTAPEGAAPGAAPAASAPRPAAPAPRPAVVPDRPAPPPAPAIAVVPAGTELSVILIDSLSSETNNAGDQFMASLGAPIVVNGRTIAERGTKVQGRVVDAEGAGRVKGRANMRLVLSGIQDGGKMIPIVTRPFAVEAEGTKGRDAAVAGGGAGIGAAIGAATGGKKGAGIGAIIGGAAGTGAVLATKGKEVEFASESKLTFTLDKSVELPVRARPIS